MLEVQERISVFGEAPRTILDGSVQVKPKGVERETDVFAVPVGPLTPMIVIVDDPVPPARIWVGLTVLAVIVKSTTVKVSGAVVWPSIPALPVTVMAYVFGTDAVQLRVTVWEELARLTLAGDVHVSPAGVDAETARLTTPVRPFSAVIVMLEFPEPPANIWDGETVVVEREKSTTWNRMLDVV